jgi:cation transport regulator ChaC
MTHFIIGYGSLLSEASLKKTCPHSEIIRPVWIHDWQRHGELPSRHNAISNDSYSVMNIIPQKGSSCNGVLMAIAERDLPALQQRESNYQQVTVHYSEGHDDGQGSTTKAIAWHGDPTDRISPIWQHDTQWEYVLTCLYGCQAISPRFLDDFLATTWMDGVTLNQHAHYQELQDRLNSMRAPTDYGYDAQAEK